MKFVYYEKMSRLKTYLKEMMDLPFAGDGITFEFLKEGKEKYFEILYDFKEDTCEINFSDRKYLNWEEWKDDDEKLAWEIIKNIYKFFVKEKIDCFLLTETPYFFNEEDLLEHGTITCSSFPFIPTGEKSKKALELLDKIPYYKNWGTSYLLLDEEIYEKNKIVVKPVIKDNPKISLYKKRDVGLNEVEDLIEDILCVNDYENFISKRKQKIKKIEQARKEILTYGKEKGIECEDDLDLFIINGKQYFFYFAIEFCEQELFKARTLINYKDIRTYDIEIAKEILKKSINYVLSYEKNVNKLINELQKKFTHTFVREPIQNRTSFEFYNGESLKEFNFYLELEENKYDEKDVKCFCVFEYEGEKFKKDINYIDKMIMKIDKLFSKELNTIRTKQLFNKEAFVFFPRLCYELGIKDPNGTHIETYTTPFELRKNLEKVFEGRNHNQILNKEYLFLNLGDLYVFKSKNTVIIEKDLELFEKHFKSYASLI